MRLGILVYSLSGGGAERVVSYLLNHFHKRGVEVHLILMNDDIKFAIPNELPIHFLEKSKAAEAGIKKLLKIPFLAYKYAKLCKKLGLTHSLSLLTRPNYVNVLAKFFNAHPVKLMISERAYPSLQYGYGGLNSKINKNLISLLYKKADLVICNSKGNQRDLIDNFKVPADLTLVINNPIDLEKIDAVDSMEDYFDKKFFNLISVGRMDAGKNHKLLINSIADLDNVRLYILGDGGLRSEIETLIRTKNLVDRVFLLGFQSNPYTYLKSADLFIFGSNHEGFPNVLLEAMACGLPILSTNCKSGPDEILEYSEVEKNDLMVTPNGILVPIKNTTLMRDGIRYFLDNPSFLDSCKLNVKERVTHYNTPKIIEQFERAIFQNL